MLYLMKTNLFFFFYYSSGFVYFPVSAVRYQLHVVKLEPNYTVFCPNSDGPDLHREQIAALVVYRCDMCQCE